MDKMKKSLAILNLTGEFPSELKHYFASRNILVVDPLSSSHQDEWTHIITKDIHNFDLINDTYKLTENDIRVISLSKVEDLQNFTINNGDIVLDDCWFKNVMGPFIMDKYFQGFGGITLGDNYPAFQEQGSFNVANPFNTGEYLDRMVQKAFESGIEALTLKTYFDHLVMYLAGLKKKGRIGLPFEVTYGSFEDIFAVQIHFFSHHLDVMDVATSLSSVITKKAEEYFLNTAVQSADFFDFSYMPDVNKVVVTGLWTKDERIKFENRGLMFMSLTGGAPLAKYENEGATSSIIGGKPLEDLTEKVVIPSTLSPEVSKNVVKGSQAEAETSTVVKSKDLPSDSTGYVVKPFNEDEEDFGTVVSGGMEETPDEVSLIKNTQDELEELVQTVQGKFEDDKAMVRVSGNKLNIDETAYRIAASVDEATEEKNLKVRSLGNQLPQQIKTGLFDFAKDLNKSVEDLSDHDLDSFQLKKLPGIIQEGLKTEIQKVKQLNNVPEQKDSMTVKSLNNEKPASVGAVNAAEMKQLEAKLQAAAGENEKLKSQLKTMSSEVRILKESRLKMAEINMKASQAANEVNVKKEEDSDDVLRKQFAQKLQDQKALNDQEMKKLSGLLERESKLIHEVRQEEMKTKKLQIEAQQKETFFVAELEKSERQTKAKDLMLIKTKETFTKLIEKKDHELSDLRNKTDQLSKALATGPAQAQAQQIKDLERQNQNLNKQLDVYKIKLSSLATNFHAGKGDDNSKDELKKQQIINQQLKNQLDAAKRDIDKWQARLSADNAQIVSLKQEKLKLEQLLKKATLDAKEKEAVAIVPGASASDHELKRLQAQNQILETQVKDSSQKINNLENKLAEYLKPQKPVATGDESNKVKVSQLENSVKKLTQDLVESRNQLAEAKKETNKLRQDKTALQNQLDKLKKEADKGKSAAPKKPGGKAA